MKVCLKEEFERKNLLCRWKRTFQTQEDVVGSGVSERDNVWATDGGMKNLLEMCITGASEMMMKGCVRTHCETHVNEVKHAVWDVLPAWD